MECGAANRTAVRTVQDDNIIGICQLFLLSSTIFTVLKTPAATYQHLIGDVRERNTSFVDKFDI